MLQKKIRGYALALAVSLLLAQQALCAPDMNKAQWSYELPELPADFKGYDLENDSGTSVISAIAGLAGVTGGKKAFNASVSIEDREAEITQVLFDFDAYPVKGNKTLTTFTNATFSIDESEITRTQGGSGSDRITIDADYDLNAGGYVRVLKQQSTSVQTKLLDGSAPVVDQSTLLLLMRGANKQPKFYDGKHFYLFVNSMVRKYRIAYVGEDRPNHPETGLKVKAHRFQLVRDGVTVGAIWVESDGQGNPLRFEIGKLRYNIKPL